MSNEDKRPPNDAEPMNQADRDLMLAAADQKFREQMKQSDDPKAQEWVKLDESAQKQEKRVGEYASSISQRKDMGLDLYQTEQQLSEAQNGRDAHLSSGRPSMFQREEREKWDSKQASWAKEVGEHQKGLMELARKSSPERIEDLQNRMEEKQQTLHQTLADRQGIAKLPSEVAQVSMKDRIEQSKSAWSPSQDEGQLQSGNAQGLVQTANEPQPDGTAQGVRLRPDYIKGLETQADRDWTKQLEQDQTTMHQMLGRPATDAEMQDFTKQREAKQQAAQQSPQQDAFQQQVQQRRNSQSQ